MALIACPECKAQVSDQASNCPKCGFPFKAQKMTGTRKRILVVDDEAEVRSLVERRLNTNGYDVITAVDGKDAVEKAKQSTPNLIILDVLMPKMDGFATLGALRRDPQTSKIPVIMLTARGETSAILEAQKLGAADFVIKPFEPADLLAVVKQNI